MPRTVVGTCCLMLAAVAVSGAAELPPGLQKEIDKVRADYDAKRAAAETKLLAAFDAETNAIRKQADLKAEEKQAAIEAVGVERASFEKYGVVPFSPRMRAAALVYLKVAKDSRLPVATAYDKAVEFYTKAKDDDTAKAMVAEKAKVLPPKVVGVWQCTGVNFKGSFTRTLYADGSASGGNKNTWALEKGSMVITIFQPGCPLGGWVDKCELGVRGQFFSARNQRGGTYTARLIDP